MNENISLKKVLVSIADAIRSKRYPDNAEKKINPQEFDNEILNISFETFAPNMADYTGYGLKVLDSVTIDDSIETIKSNAFQSTSIISITLGSGVKTIATNAFANCANLSTVVFNNVISTLADSSFYRCKSLKKITLPNSITSVASPFYGCSGLEELKIVENEKYSDCNKNVIFDKINNILVQGCKTSEIPDSTVILGTNAFAENSPTSITIPDSVKTIKAKCFFQAGLTSIELGIGVETIESSAFSATRLKNITFPDNVKVLGNYLFQGTPMLNSVTMSKNLEVIPSNFCSGSTIETLTFPEGSVLENIKNDAFLGCYNFKLLDLSGVNSIPTLGTNVFKDCPSSLQIKVPTGWKIQLAEKTNWSDVIDNVVEVEAGV